MSSKLRKLKKLREAQRESRVSIRDSTIVGSGKGLFANVDMRKGSVIAKFKGRLHPPGAKIADQRSNIYFSDGYILECDKDTPASFANDVINFPKHRRRLMETLKSSEPFYQKHEGARINAELKRSNTGGHLAYLSATENIKAGEEIFCHYGLMYWFQMEMRDMGFLLEDEIKMFGFPEKFYIYPAIESYFRHFYPNFSHFKVDPYETDYIMTIYLTDGTSTCGPVKNFAKMSGWQYYFFPE